METYSFNSADYRVAGGRAVDNRAADYRIHDWPKRPFRMETLRVHGRPRQQSDGLWWVRGVLFDNPGRIVVDAGFRDLGQPAVELYYRNLEFLKQQSEQVRKAIRSEMRQLLVDTQLTDSERAQACKRLLHELDEFGCYGNHAEVRALSRKLLDYFKLHYRFERRYG